MASSERPALAVISFDDKSGPAKTWSRVSQIEQHNSRRDKLAHVLADAPGPLHMIGSGNLVADCKAALARHKIGKLRKGGNIGWEVVMSASHHFFFPDGKFDPERTAAWIQATATFAADFWGYHRVIGLTFHLDEYTPHAHCFVMPLVFRAGGRFGPRWTSDTASIAGPGVWQKTHDSYAQAIEGLGIDRGERGANSKNRPFGQVMEAIEGRERTADASEAASLIALQQAKETAERLAAREDDFQRRLALLHAEEAETELRRRDADTILEGAKAKNEQAAKLLSAAEAHRAMLVRLGLPLHDATKTAQQLVTAIGGIPLEQLPASLLRALDSVDDLADAVRPILADQDGYQLLYEAALARRKGRGE